MPKGQLVLASWQLINSRLSPRPPVLASSSRSPIKLPDLGPAIPSILVLAPVPCRTVRRTPHCPSPVPLIVIRTWHSIDHLCEPTAAPSVASVRVDRERRSQLGVPQHAGL